MLCVTMACHAQVSITRIVGRGGRTETPNTARIPLATRSFSVPYFKFNDNYTLDIVGDIEG